MFSGRLAILLLGTPLLICSLVQNKVNYFPSQLKGIWHILSAEEQLLSKKGVFFREHSNKIPARKKSFLRSLYFLWFHSSTSCFLLGFLFFLKKMLIQRVRPGKMHSWCILLIISIFFLTFLHQRRNKDAWNRERNSCLQCYLLANGIADHRLYI